MFSSLLFTQMLTHIAFMLVRKVFFTALPVCCYLYFSYLAFKLFSVKFVNIIIKLIVKYTQKN